MSDITAPPRRAAFHSMQESTAQDWHIIGEHSIAFARALPERLLTHLRLLEGDCGGYAVDRLRHSLLTATLAARAGEDDEYIACALLHDIGDTLGPWNHPDIAASILKPFVSEENLWMVEKHGIFQGYNFFHHLGLDRNMREQFQDHPSFERTERFVQLYDNPAFDPKMDFIPLQEFEPVLRRVMTRVRKSIYLPNENETKLPRR